MNHFLAYYFLLHIESIKFTGKFKEDLESVCTTKRIRFIPEIVPRARRPSSSYRDQTGDVSKFDRAVKGKLVASKAVAENEEDEPALVVDNAPKTYTVKENYDFFKPKINVEMQTFDKVEAVTEIHIKGWKIEKSMMEVLNLCFPHIERLSTIR